MTTKTKTDRKEERGESLTGRTPKLADLKIGQVLHAKFKGKQHTGTVVEQDGVRLLKVAGKLYRSLSAAGEAITGKACRGGVFWGLLPRPDYRAMAGASEPSTRTAAKRPARKTTRAKATAKKSAPRGTTGGPVKSSWLCGSCRQKFETQAKLMAHVRREHPEGK
jgi:hypothetical protein